MLMFGITSAVWCDGLVWFRRFPSFLKPLFCHIVGEWGVWNCICLIIPSHGGSSCSSCRNSAIVDYA